MLVSIQKYYDDKNENSKNESVIGMFASISNAARFN